MIQAYASCHQNGYSPPPRPVRCSGVLFGYRPVMKEHSIGDSEVSVM